MGKCCNNSASSFFTLQQSHTSSWLKLSYFLWQLFYTYDTAYFVCISNYVCTKCNIANFSRFQKIVCGLQWSEWKCFKIVKLSRNGHTWNVCLLQWRKTTTVLPQKSKQKIEDSCFIVCEWNFRELLPFLDHSWTLLSSSQHRWSLLLHSRNLSRALICILLSTVCFCFLLCSATLYNFNHVSAVDDFQMNTFYTSASGVQLVQHLSTQTTFSMHYIDNFYNHYFKQ